MRPLGGLEQFLFKTGEVESCVLRDTFPDGVGGGSWDGALRALACSSTSSKTSCFTALIEYAQTPMANEATANPVTTLRRKNGRLARKSDADMPYAQQVGSDITEKQK